MKAKGPDTFWSWWGLAKNSWKMLEGGGTMSVTGAGSNLGDFRTHFVSSNFCRKKLFILCVVFKSWPVCRQTAENVEETAVPGPMCTWRNFWPHFVSSNFLRKLLFILCVVLKSWPVCRQTAENVGETAVPGPMCTWRNFWPHFVSYNFLRKLLFILSVVLKSWPVLPVQLFLQHFQLFPAKPVKISIRRTKWNVIFSKNSRKQSGVKSHLMLTQLLQQGGSAQCTPSNLYPRG